MFFAVSVARCLRCKGLSKDRMRWKKAERTQERCCFAAVGAGYWNNPEVDL